MALTVQQRGDVLVRSVTVDVRHVSKLHRVCVDALRRVAARREEEPHQPACERKAGFERAPVSRLQSGGGCTGKRRGGTFVALPCGPH